MSVSATHDRPLAPRRFRRSTRLALTTLAVLLSTLAAAAVLVSALANHAGDQRLAATEPTTAPLAYEPHELVVGYSGTLSAALAEIRGLARVAVTVSPQTSLTPHEQILELPSTASVTATAGKLRALPGISYAVPDYVAHIAGSWFPDDTGRGHKAKGWERLQWNFLAKDGINAPGAWANLIADHRPGAKGVMIAVVDTGIAYRKWRTFRRSPDFRGTKFVDPCDLIDGSIHDGRCTDPYALDRESHGTFVAGMIAEATNNHFGLTGLAYEATIMPVRVLDAQGNGAASTIAAGIRYAVQKGAQVINLSIEFSPGTTRAQIPDVAAAVDYAHSHGVLVVAAAGNDEHTSIDYPAALPDVISVGATTSDRCLAVYSDVGRTLSLVAPGGGDDAASVPGSVCHPTRNLPDIYQMTFNNPADPGDFSLPNGWYGTSMAAPTVSGAAAMVIASGVLGQHPRPTAVLDRLEATARPLGASRPNDNYGYGLLDVAAATRKGGPLKPPPPPYSLPGAAKGVVVR
ncbi:MAG TPA: S8 family serine peptidase [Solirubrobacteraceae bacterium]|nr:S8 family serine peptidase [Solirubrobacteraceae bacterium]